MDQPAPTYVAQLQGVLTLTKAGEWWHEGRPFENRRLATLFHRSIVWHAETQCYRLAIGKEQALFRLEDTPYFVDELVDESRPWHVKLRDGSTALLSSEELYRGRENQIYCTVSKPELAYARFSRNAYQRLVQFAIDDRAVMLDDQRVELRRLAPIIIVMGVMGVGKSTVASQLASSIKAPFIDADDFHSESNRTKLLRGAPLTDDDRAPWLRAVREAMHRPGQQQPVVVACSALREDYRQFLKQGNPRVEFVFLDAPQETIRKRLLQPRASIAAPTLLESQYATLEPPQTALRIDATIPVEQIIQELHSAFFSSEPE